MHLPELTKERLMECLTPQRNDYSCGPACLATIARLHGCDKDYKFFCELLEPKANTGSHPLAMVDAAALYLPMTSSGEKIYDGGLGIGYIVYQDSEKSPWRKQDNIDHYIVLLAKCDNDIFYYDPWDDQVYQHDVRKMRWHSTFSWPCMPEKFERWSVNFKTPEKLTTNLCASIAQPHPFTKDRKSVAKIRPPAFR